MSDSVVRSRVHLTFKHDDVHNETTFTALGCDFIVPPSSDKANFDEPARTTTKGVIKHDFKWSTIKQDFIGFWSKFMTRVWVFFVEALWIPAYRPEWGKYKMWKYHYGSRNLKKKMERSSSTDSAKQLEESDSRRKLLRKSAISEIKEQKLVQSAYKTRKLKHDPIGCEILRFNITGMIYETQRKTLHEFPDTLLGDPIRRAKYWDPKNHEYFFDRHRKSFEAILNFYQTGGILRRPPEISLPVFEDEVRFYDLGNTVIYNYLLDEGIMNIDDFPKPIPKNLLLRKIYFFMEYPESSSQGKFAALFSVYVVILSTVLFCIETLPLFITHESHTTRLADPFFLCETVCVVWFSLDLVIRFVVSPKKWNFVKEMMNIIDTISIIPFYLAVLASPDHDAQHEHDSSSITRRRDASTTLVMLRIFRLFRVFRIFKLSRHSSGLQILGKTLRASLRELGLLMFFLMIGVVIFASLIFFAESAFGSAEFTSIPDAFWWGIVTMTSLGYGDKVPETVMGRVVGSFCAVAAVLTLALPIPVFVANFNYFYQKETQQEGRKEMTSSSHVQSCPYLPDCPALEERSSSSDDSEYEFSDKRLTFRGVGTFLRTLKKMTTSKLDTSASKFDLAPSESGIEVAGPSGTQKIQETEAATAVPIQVSLTESSQDKNGARNESTNVADQAGSTNHPQQVVINPAESTAANDKAPGRSSMDENDKAPGRSSMDENDKAPGRSSMDKNGKAEGRSSTDKNGKVEGRISMDKNGKAPGRSSADKNDTAGNQRNNSK